MKPTKNALPNSPPPLKPTAMLLPAAILMLSITLLSGCGGRATQRPSLPMAFHFLEPGTTNQVVIPPNCAYGIWTTDAGLLYLQGLNP